MCSGVGVLAVWYHVGVGSGPDKDDVVAFTTVEYTAASHCFETLQLTHNSIYYVTVFAFNGGHVEKNSSSHSDGGEPLLQYSQSSYGVQSGNWEQFPRSYASLLLNFFAVKFLLPRYPYLISSTTFVNTGLLAR